MIKFRDLSVAYTDKVIFKDVDLDIPDEGISFLMGKNGSGKTTLIKCILDLMDYKGKIETNCEKHDLKELFVIFDDSALYNGLTGLDNIMQFASCDKKTAFEYGEQYLNRDLLLKKTKTYSYGERKKVFLIILEILKPKIIIMDEVSNGLDYETMVLLKERFLELSKNSLIIMTGHQFEFYKNIINRVYVIHDTTIERIEMDNNMSLEEIYEKTVK